MPLCHGAAFIDIGHFLHPVKKVPAGAENTDIPENAPGESLII